MRTLTASLVFAGLALTTACKQPDPATALKQRFTQLATNICNSEPEKCVELVDPVYVRAQGSDKVIGSFKFMVGLYKFMKVDATKVRIDDVLILPKGLTAEVRYSIQVNGEWKAQEKPTNWRLVDGQWFLQL